MFYKYDDEFIRLTGRWGKTQNSAVTTATGSKIEFVFYGDMAVLHFDITWNQPPYPHMWVIVDNGAKIEVPVDTYLRIQTHNSEMHQVEIIYKGAVEMQHRWYDPLVGKIAFKGIEVERMGVLTQNMKKTIEFLGDSITEGVLIDESYKTNEFDQLNRPFQDDVTATYAYLTAQNLNLEPIFMGYGGIGTTHGGCGSVPKAADAYPYCFSGSPVTYKPCDYILINYGANDKGYTKDQYISGYKELLDVVIKMNPKSQLIVLSAFCECYEDALEAFIKKYNSENNKNIIYISSFGWVPAKPLHPARDGHKIIADCLTKELKEKLGL